MPYPVIPEYITVHLGAPDAPAENVTVTFPRYIKGVAASEIYPTWNESAIRANVTRLKLDRGSANPADLFPPPSTPASPARSRPWSPVPSLWAAR